MVANRVVATKEWVAVDNKAALKYRINNLEIEECPQISRDKIQEEATKGTSIILTNSH